jgi:hypothetical protein
MNSTSIAIDVAKSVFEVAVSEQPGKAGDTTAVWARPQHSSLMEQPLAGRSPDMIDTSGGPRRNLARPV